MIRINVQKFDDTEQKELRVFGILIFRRRVNFEEG